jgi:hypothetical protein
MMLFIVPVRVQDSQCMGFRLVSWDISFLSGVRLLVVLLVVVWPVVFDMPINGGFLDMYMFCMLHVLYIQSKIYWFGVPKDPSLGFKRAKIPKTGKNEPRNGQRQAISYYNH